MGKGFLKRKRALRGSDTAKGSEKGPCFFPGCTTNGGTIHHCVTCEKLAEVRSIPPSVVVRIQTCRKHNALAVKKIRKHALVAHPMNMLRVVVAGLKGEDIS